MTKKENSTEISLQLVKSEEVEILATLVRNTFVTAFGQFNTEEDMKQYVDERLTPSYIAGEMDVDGSYFYFAKISKVIVGYLKLNINQAQNEPIGSKGLEIERVYVDRHFQGKGIGQKLLNFSLDKAREWNRTIVWLGVWDRNPGAIKLYKRNGFEQFGSHDFLLGSDLQTDLLMKLELNDQEK